MTTRAIFYVVNWGNRDVHRFDTEGNDLGQFVDGELMGGPVNLWFDDAGDLLVVDWESGSVYRYNGETGAYKSTFITGMGRSEGATVGPDGFIYVCD